MPRSTLPRCGTPRTPLRLPWSPAVVSLSPGISWQPANAAPCRGCRSCFPFSCYGSLLYPPCGAAARHIRRQAFPREAPPSSPFQVSRMCCVLTYCYSVPAIYKKYRNIYCQGTPPAMPHTCKGFVHSIYPHSKNFHPTALWLQACPKTP